LQDIGWTERGKPRSVASSDEEQLWQGIFRPRLIRATPALAKVETGLRRQKQVDQVSNSIDTRTIRRV